VSAFDLLVAASAPQLDSAKRARIVDLASSITEWDEVLDLGDACRALPILHDRLACCAADKVPAPILERLEQAHLANTTRTAAMVRCLSAAIQALNHAGIPAVAYKGPTLAQLAYDSPGLRQFDDLDILVPGKQFGEAKSVLETQDYAEILGLPSHLATSSRRRSKPCILRHRDGSHDIDLSSRLLHNYFSFRIPAADLWQAMDTVQLDGCTLRTVSVSVLLLYLCAHGSKHLWARPAWIADVAGLLSRQQAAIDWRIVKRLALKADGIRMLQLGVALAGRNYGAPVPDTEVSWLTPSETVSELADKIMVRQRASAGQPEKDDWERARFHLALHCRVRSRLRYLFVRGLTPSYNDWRSLHLPPPLFPLYVPYRIGRLIIRMLRRLPQRLRG